MTMAFSDQIAAKIPREKGGPTGSNRYDFQKDWVICKLLELHRRQDDYLVLCDYHEDVVILDSARNPTLAEFFQVKTKKLGGWTIPNLLARARAKAKPSMLGKLYVNFMDFPQNTAGLNFVSNAYYKFKLRDGKSSTDVVRITCGEIESHEVEKINKYLGTELNCSCELPHKPNLVFDVTDLSLADHQSHVVGKISVFFDEFLPGITPPIATAYRTLFDEVRRKTNYEPTESEFKSLREKKGITPALLKSLVQAAASRLDLDKTWPDIHQALLHENMAPLEIAAVKRCWTEYQVKRMNYSDYGLQALRVLIGAKCSEAIRISKTTPLLKLRDLIMPSVYAKDIDLYGTDFVMAMILMETYEAIALSTADSKFTD